MCRGDGKLLPVADPKGVLWAYPKALRFPQDPGAELIFHELTLGVHSHPELEIKIQPRGVAELGVYLFVAGADASEGWEIQFRDWSGKRTLFRVVTNHSGAGVVEGLPIESSWLYFRASILLRPPHGFPLAPGAAERSTAIGG